MCKSKLHSLNNRTISQNISIVLLIIISISLTLIFSSCAVEPPVNESPKIFPEQIKIYLSKVQPIIDSHYQNMSVAASKHEECLKLISENLPMKAVSGSSKEELAHYFAASNAPSNGVNTMEKALLQLNSDFTDFKVLYFPNGAETYHSLLNNYFLKSQAALDSWQYFWQAVNKKLQPDSSLIEQGNRHYEDAIEFRLQAEKEKQSLTEKYIR